MTETVWLVLTLLTALMGVGALLAAFWPLLMSDMTAGADGTLPSRT